MSKLNLFNKSKLHYTNNELTKSGQYIVDIENLSVNFKTKAGIIHAVRDVTIKIKPGEIIGIVGESGSGKSVTVKSLIGFNDNSIIKAKNLDFKELDISKIDSKAFKYIRGSRIAYIPQDPLLSLNPTKKIGAQIIESIKVTKKRKLRYKFQELKKQLIEDTINLATTIENSKPIIDQYDAAIKNTSLTEEQLINLKNRFDAQLYKMGKSHPSYQGLVARYKASKEEEVKNYKASITSKNIKKILFEVLNFIGIKDVGQRIKDYPHEFSGGMRQRIVIAMAIVSEPDLIIADEPTTALDVTIQAKVLDLIKKLRDELNITIVLISHNIGLVANFCDFIYVMYAGKIVEQGLVKDIFTNPRHPYTWALISSIPDSNTTEELQSIPGTPPNLLIPPVGDAFAPRNKYAIKLDFEEQPPLFTVANSKTHKAATWLLHPDSPMKTIPKDILSKIEVAKKSIALKEEIKNSKQINKPNN